MENGDAGGDWFDWFGISCRLLRSLWYMLSLSGVRVRVRDIIKLRSRGEFSSGSGLVLLDL